MESAECSDLGETSAAFCVKVQMISELTPVFLSAFRKKWVGASVKDILLSPLWLYVCLKCTRIAQIVKGGMARSDHVYR